jgi:hypothetical protein
MLPVNPEAVDVLCAYEGCARRWTISLNAKRGYCSSHAWVLLHDRDDPRKSRKTVDSTNHSEEI